MKALTFGAPIGGTLEIESSRKRGTAVNVRVPDVTLKKRKAIQAETDTGWHTPHDPSVR